ncbi:MAG: hypothetical protein KatS3mg076_3203 [Candidatus Binatia bacterium]|nr:MAG: hypothetical protein KatS3mg076_3203 [Candidatus Binatia bacterium]
MAKFRVRFLAPGMFLVLCGVNALAASPDDGFTFAYKPGKGFQIQTADGSHALSVGGRIQLRYTAADLEEEKDRSTFRVQRARFWFVGHVYDPRLRYGFQGDIADDFELRDAYLEIAHLERAVLKLGQYKVPFNRQQLTSSARLQFVDRSITNAEFLFGDDGRDVGAMIYGDLRPDLLAYQVGVFNGSGPNTVNDNASHLVVGRLLFTPLGPFEDYYSEGDQVGERRARFGIGVAAGFEADEKRGRTVERTGLVALPGFREADILGVTADAQFKYAGFSVLGDYHFRRVDPDGSGLSSFDAHGFVVQAGYYLVPQKLEIAARYAWVDRNDDVGDNGEREYGGALAYYISGHNLKIQADLREVDRERPGADTKNDLEGRLQIQAIF